MRIKKEIIPSYSVFPLLIRLHRVDDQINFYDNYAQNIENDSNSGLCLYYRPVGQFWSSAAAQKSIRGDKYKRGGLKKKSTVSPTTFALFLKGNLLASPQFKMVCTILFARNCLNGRRAEKIHNYFVAFYRVSEMDIHGKDFLDDK